MEAFIPMFKTFISALGPFFLLLGVLIFIHEFGHFIVARWCGVRVEVFSLGFGKKLFQFKKGDTTYCISLIPLGGYVKMFGEQPGSQIPEAEKSVSFTHKTVWQRIAIVSAGPLMNFFFAIVLFAAIGLTGEDVKAPVVPGVLPQSYAESVGLKAGDIIKKVNTIEIKTWDQFQNTINEFKNQQINLEVLDYSTEKIKQLSVQVSAKENPNIIATESIIGDIQGFTTFAKGTAVAIEPQSALKVLGFENGDLITALNGNPIQSWHQLEKQVSQIDFKNPVEFEIRRVNEQTLKEAKKIEDLPKIQITLNGSDKSTRTLQDLGLLPADTFIGKVMEKTPAESAELKAGDQILAINGKRIQVWEEILVSVKGWDEQKPLVFEVARQGELIKKSISPKAVTIPNSQGLEEKRFAIGIQPFISVGNIDTVTLQSENIFQALGRGFERTYHFSELTIMSFVRLFQAKVSPKNIGGVISIGQAAHETFKMGFVQFLSMMAIISVNLFILNLLPVPVLDGGHLVFYTIEAIKGSPLSLKKIEFAQQIGIILLMSLMVFALFNDFTRLFRS